MRRYTGAPDAGSVGHGGYSLAMTAIILLNMTHPHKRFLVCSSILVWLAASSVWSQVAVQPEEGGAHQRVPPLSTAEALQTFRVPAGFEMQLLAAEPMVTSPVAMEYDENGVAYVVEMRDYPYTDKSTDKPFVERTTDLPLGRIRVLRDLDGDGVFDKSTIFAEDLSWPTGLAFWKGGIYVIATPDLWYLKDTDGDDRADVRRKVFSGFRKFNVQAVANNLKWGLDHYIYGAGGSNGGMITHPDHPERPPVNLGQNDFRFDPRTEQFEVIAGGARFGNTFDDSGERFICNIRNPLQHVVIANRYLARNPYLPVRSAIHDAAEAGDTLPVFRISPPEPWRVQRAQRFAAEAGQRYPRSETTGAGFFTSSSGVTIYRGTAYGGKFYGNAFIGEVAGNAVHRQIVERDGVTFKSRRADEGIEFIASTDTWFRPVNFVNAPDGTLNIVDMYRETIEHPWSIPDDIKEKLDLESGRDRGRIYRLAVVGNPAKKITPLGKSSTYELVSTLHAQDCWRRETAHRLLLERRDDDAVPLLRRTLNQRTKLAALCALWLLNDLDQLTDEDLCDAMRSGSDVLCRHAIWLAEPKLPQSEDLLKCALRLSEHTDPAVRFQLALTLGGVKDERATQALIRMAQEDAQQPWMRLAILSSSADRALDLLNSLLSDKILRNNNLNWPLLHDLAYVVGARNRPEEIDKLLGRVALLPTSDEVDCLAYRMLLALHDATQRTGRRLQEFRTQDDAALGVMIIEALRAAQRTLENPEATADDQRTAISLVRLGTFTEARKVLEPMLGAAHAGPIQQAAVKALAGYPDTQVAQTLMDACPQLTPGVRGEVIEALMARPGRIPVLLEALDAGFFSTSQISPARRDVLVKNSDQNIRHHAERLFATDARGPRTEALERYKQVPTVEADPARGRQVYIRECRTCHRLGHDGFDVGPNLESIRNRSPDEILTNIIDPNREVSPNYLEYAVAMSDGRITTGIIAAETPASITIRRPEGVEETILRQDIQAISSSGKSLMPEGLETKITPQEMTDLLAFLLKR